MATIRYSMRQKKWIVTWKVRGATFHHECASEESALSFSEIQRTISQKEKERFTQTKPIRKSITIRELFDHHFSLCSKRPITIKQDLYHARPLLQSLGTKQVASITQKEILAFCKSQKASGLAQSTIHRRISLLRSIASWGKREGYLSSAIENCSVSKGKARRTPPPTVSELNALLRVAVPHVQRVILLGIYTGARIGPSELFSLKWDDVDLTHGVISMPNANKGSKLKKRDIPIRKDLIPTLARWQHQDADCPYVINWSGKPVRKIAAAWKTALQKSGIRAIRPYDLRHAYATYSIRSGADIKTSAEIMGHENARMILEVYEHVDWAQKVRAIEGMPDFFALAPKAVRNPIHERRPRKREIDEPGAKYCVRNTVPALNDRKHLIHSEIKNQNDHPTDKDAPHKRNTKTKNPCGPECRGQKERGYQHDLSQQTEQEKLKQETQKPHPFVAKPEYRAEKQHDRTQPRKDSTHDNLHDGAPQWDAPG